MEALPALCHMQRYCGYAPWYVACSETHLSGECSTSQQQLKCCGCGGNHTANYQGCVKWKDAKAVLAKQTSVEHSKGGGTPGLPVAPKANQVEPTAKQERLGPGCNHVHWGHVVRASPPTNPESTASPVTETPTQSKVTNTSKKGKTAKSVPKVTVGPKHAQETKPMKPTKPAKPLQPKPKELVVPPQPNEEISDLLDKLVLIACVELSGFSHPSPPSL